MFNLGFLEIFIIVAIGLIVLGPDQFPKMARKFLIAINDLKNSFKDVNSEMKNIESEIKETLSESKKTLLQDQEEKEKENENG